MAKIEFNWDGRVSKPEAANAQLRKCWAITGGRVVQLETYRIDGRLHYRDVRSSSPRLSVMQLRTFDAVYTTRQEAREHTDPGKRTKVWAVDYTGTVVELSKSPSGQLYHQDGRSSYHKVTYRRRRDACAEGIKKLRHEAEMEAKALRAKRRKIAKLRTDRERTP